MSSFAATIKPPAFPTREELLEAVTLVTRTAEMPKGRKRAGKLILPPDTYRLCVSLTQRELSAHMARQA